jgi:hypothetical protein
MTRTFKNCPVVTVTSLCGWRSFVSIASLMPNWSRRSSVRAKLGVALADTKDPTVLVLVCLLW